MSSQNCFGPGGAACGGAAAVTGFDDGAFGVGRDAADCAAGGAAGCVVATASFSIASVIGWKNSRSNPGFPVSSNSRQTINAHLASAAATAV